MIAAIDKQQRVVWGIGRTEAQALADARDEAASKQPGVKPGALDCVPLKPGAPLDATGAELWHWCDLAQSAIQQELF